MKNFGLAKIAAAVLATVSHAFSAQHMQHTMQLREWNDPVAANASYRRSTGGQRAHKRWKTARRSGQR